MKFKESNWVFMRFLLFVILLVFLSLNQSNGQASEEIISKHHIAMNQPFWEATRTISITGKLNSPKGLLAMRLLAKKPNNIVVYGKWKKKRFALAYDGTEAWTIAPWHGTGSPQLMSPEEEISIKHVMEFGSPLKAQSKVDYRGEIVDNGVDCYWFIERNEQFEIEYFINRKTYVMHKLNKRERYNNSILLMSKQYQSYRDFGGILFPSSITIKTASEEFIYSFDEIIIGEGINSSIFQKKTHQ